MFRASATLLAAAAVIAAGPGCTAQAGDSPPPTESAGIGTVVRTASGSVSGARDGEVLRWRGIPYAAPPVGENRFRAPQPVEPWDGIRPATAPGAACAQGPARGDAREDCLYVDVTAPAGVSASSGGRPVMVWLHGGGFAEGAGIDYDPARLAARGDVVVVTVDFRLGLYGFFGHDGLPGSGTFGLQDQQAALRWVHDNAAAFGGDPGNVTLFGESGGAVGACAQLTSPAAEGLFDRLILQSGSCLLEIPRGGMPPSEEGFRFWRPLAATEAEGARTATALGCRGDAAAVVACLREQPASAFDPHHPAFGAAASGTELLPRDPAAALRAGGFHRVPVVSGHNRDEHRLTAGLLALAGYPITAADYPARIAQAFGDDAPAVLRRYPPATYGGDAALAWAAVFTDRMWACSQARASESLAAHVPVFTYEFADGNAQPYVDLPPGFPAGASHASELPNLFDVVGRQPITGPRYSDAQRRLADRMIGYWTAFARSGDPNHSGAPTWPRSGDGPTSLRLAPDAPEPIDAPSEHNCTFWSSLS